MAKAIRLDFSKTEERSGWNTRHISEGLHEMKIVGVQTTEAQDGTPMWVYALVPTNPKLKTRRFPYYCKLQQNQLWKLRDLLVAAGITVPKKAVNIDPEKPVGKLIAAEVADDEYQGNVRSSVQGTYGLDIIDADSTGSSDDEDDEDDEEYEGDEEEVDEDEGYEDEEDEDEGEDLSTLTLPELRKLAKSLGIDTNGVKKADLIELIEEEQGAEEDDEDEDDEDDLDDEDLDDEELEDEEFEDDEDEDEEEEAPAPTRRSAPARKPAAKAPARRTVKRR